MFNQKKKHATWLFVAIAGMGCHTVSAKDDQGNVWHARAFGQSVDVNFETNVLPEKKGVNYVWIKGKTAPMTPDEVGNIETPFTIESRGGKIANTHDGLTFYYTRLDTDQNFVLEADVTIEQFGPETAATPNAQEGAGLMVRDVIGVPRQEPLVLGYEEFPAASNMVANSIMTQNKKKDGELNLQFIYRDGVNYPFGNQGAIIPKATYTTINYTDSAKPNYQPQIKMKLERTDTGFVVSTAHIDGSNLKQHTVKNAPANIVQSIDPKNMYVGFFASRNAKVSFDNAKLTVSPARTVEAAKFVAAQPATHFEIVSPDKTTEATYRWQARSDYSGTLSVMQKDNVLKTAPLVAGDFFVLPVTLDNETNHFTLNFTPNEGPDINKALSTVLTVTKVVGINDPKNIFVAPTGKADNTGSEASPLDLVTALNYVAPGGTIHLLDGVYEQAITMPISVSGSPSQLKTLSAVHPHAVTFKGNTFVLDANYWHLKGITITESPDRTNGLLISGSHNVIENVITHHNGNTGLQLSTRPKLGRALWPKDNLILNSESHHNQDSPMKDADGFAAKLGVGPGNIFRGCLSHDNIDDGWDLFNKIEDGPNEFVRIENSLAYKNRSNGFKLGGEAQLVAHVLQNSIAFHNGLDGITDNFNPGALVVDNTISLDNKRFNYIFRTNPYDIKPSAKFTNNISLRTDYADKYDDAVVGSIDPKSNYFIVQAQSKNGEGQNVNANAWVTLTPPATFKRAADGTILREGFLERK